MSSSKTTASKPASDSDNSGKLSASKEFLEEVRLAREGINLLLNNGFSESEKLFSKYKSVSPLMSAGSSLVDFMQAVLTFEEDKMDEAIESLKRTQRLCHLSKGDKKRSSSRLSTEDRLMRQILYSDCELYMALLTFLKQGLTDYIKGGLMLRRAWKIYNRCVREMEMLGGTFLSTTVNLNRPPEYNGVDDIDEDLPVDEDDDPFGDEPFEGGVPPVCPDLEVLKRLQASVSFGFGLFHLAISMVPPKMLKFCHLLGFRGDRRVGLQALELANKSEDMKAPIARLALLWYHSVVRPFFALDGCNLDAGKELCGLTDAMTILDESNKEYPSSSVFLYFRGLVCRMTGDLDDALQIFNQAMSNASEQREIMMICNYEIGWCHLLKLDWDYALPSFFRLKEESRWSQGYYAYLTAVTLGAQGIHEEAMNYMRSVPKLTKKKTPLEIFLIRKAGLCKKSPPSIIEYRILGYELIYLWRAFPTCSVPTLNQMLSDLKYDVSSFVIPLKLFIQGAIYQTLNQDNNAIKYFQESISKSGRNPCDTYIPAFATYELGILYIRNKQTFEKGQQLLHQAKDFSGYDFENRLSFRVHAALEGISRGSSFYLNKQS